MSEPWSWDEAAVRSGVSGIGAGRSLAPASWPGGMRAAVTLSFDSDHDEFDLAYAEGGLFQLTMHPHVIGHPVEVCRAGRADRAHQGPPERVVRDARRGGQLRGNRGGAVRRR